MAWLIPGRDPYLDSPLNIIIHVQLKYSGVDSSTDPAILTLNLHNFGVKQPVSAALGQ